MVTEKQKNLILGAIRIASEQWKSAFNSGDAAGCAHQYEETAVMNAIPFGTYHGAAEIQEFWQKLIVDGFSNVEYVNPNVTVINDTSAILTADWKMNKASGVIHKELWVLQENGVAKLREDDFEAKQ